MGSRGKYKVTPTSNALSRIVEVKVLCRLGCHPSFVGLGVVLAELGYLIRNKHIALALMRDLVSGPSTYLDSGGGLHFWLAINLAGNFSIELDHQFLALTEAVALAHFRLNATHVHHTADCSNLKHLIV